MALNIIQIAEGRSRRRFCEDKWQCEAVSVPATVVNVDTVAAKRIQAEHC